MGASATKMLFPMLVIKRGVLLIKELITSCKTGSATSFIFVFSAENNNEVLKAMVENKRRNTIDHDNNFFNINFSIKLNKNI